MLSRAHRMDYIDATTEIERLDRIIVLASRCSLGPVTTAYETVGARVSSSEAGGQQSNPLVRRSRMNTQVMLRLAW